MDLETKEDPKIKVSKPNYEKDYGLKSEPISPVSSSHFTSHFSTNTQTIPNPKNISIMNVTTDRVFPVNLTIDDSTDKSPVKADRSKLKTQGQGRR